MSELKNTLWVKVVASNGDILLDDACHIWENDGNAIRFHIVDEHEEIETVLIPLHNIKCLISRKNEKV